MSQNKKSELQINVANYTLSTGIGTRKKVILAPGRSLIDWLRFAKNSTDLAGTKGALLKVTPEELRKHNKPNDAWMALKGKVYNVTPYMDYHPGGIDEIMRSAGQDGSVLFDQNHKFVNFESMLASCLVGILVDSKEGNANAKVAGSTGSLSLLPPEFNASPTNVPRKPKYPVPVHSWHQTETSVIIDIKTQFKLKRESIIMDCKDGRQLDISVIGEYQKSDISWRISFDLDDDIELNYETAVAENNANIKLQKANAGKSWRILGLSTVHECEQWAQSALQYRGCTLTAVEPVSHDTKVFVFQLPRGTRMIVPVGQHVYARMNIGGVLVERCYTSVLHSFLTRNDQQQQRGDLVYLMVKIYSDGILTPPLDALRLGDQLEISNYRGDFDERRLSDCLHLVMFAAGTGITPMYGLISHALYVNYNPDRVITLVFFNKTEADILWRDSLSELVKRHSNFKVHHVLSQADSTWSGLRGRVSREHLDMFCPQYTAGQKILYCVCGPAPYTELCIQLATEFGYDNDVMHAFQG
jgi:cytochrome-b5 reductase